MIRYYIYIFWFYINEMLVEIVQRRISAGLGMFYGFIVLELHVLLKIVWYTFVKYCHDPTTYGFNQINEENCKYRPILLLHDSMGFSWSYLGDLAMVIKKADRSVFVLNLEFGLSANEKCKRILNKMKEIQQKYSNLNSNIDLQFHQNENKGKKLLYTIAEELPMKTSLIDIVAHSNSAKVALCSLFTEDCSYLDEQGNLKFHSTNLQINKYIGKIITIASPSSRIEINWMRRMSKFYDLYNINAEFDAIMNRKKCDLEEDLPENVRYISAGHFGIVFNQTTYNRVVQFLRD